jgi:hypothetical protein
VLLIRHAASAGHAPFSGLRRLPFGNPVAASPGQPSSAFLCPLLYFVSRPGPLLLSFAVDSLSSCLCRVLTCCPPMDLTILGLTLLLNQPCVYGTGAPSRHSFDTQGGIRLPLTRVLRSRVLLSNITVKGSNELCVRIFTARNSR